MMNQEPSSQHGPIFILSQKQADLVNKIETDYDGNRFLSWVTKYSYALMFIPVPIKAKYFVPAIVLLDLFSGVTGYSIFGGGIAHFAHVGGAVVGFLMMWYWKKNQFNNNRWDRKSF